MKDLKQYVENKNRWNLIFNNPCYDLESAADRQRIADALDVKTFELIKVYVAGILSP